MIYKSKKIKTSIEINDHLMTGMSFKPGFGARKRIQDIDMIVLHWTGGEGGADRVYKTLKRRGLGVEFCVDRDGEIFQFCDPFEVDAFDAGKYNARSIGIEIVNYGFVIPPFRPPKLGRDRRTIKTKFKGMPLNIADFYKRQIESVMYLVEILLKYYPSILPMAPLAPNGMVLKRTMTKKEADIFSGVCGHYHISRRKLDPGPFLMEKVNDFLIEVGPELTPVRNRSIREAPW